MRRAIVPVLVWLTFLTFLPGGSLAQARADDERSVWITWVKCTDPDVKAAHAQCGFVHVPLDPSEPEGKKIELAFSRVVHTSSAADYKGVIIFNNGGPGVGAYQDSTFGSVFPTVSADYDWIGLDPRGVEYSRPLLTCEPHYFQPPKPPYSPVTPAVAHRWLSKAAAYTRACEASKAAELLPFDSTVDSAYDLDAVRRALGVDQINYYGFSYGTYLGQLYATLFPTHVGRMILDGFMNPQLNGYSEILAQAMTNERNVNFWFHWLARYHGVYHLGKTAGVVRKLFFSTERALATHAAGGQIGPAEWVDIFFLATFVDTEYFWPTLGQLFSGWIHKHDSGSLIDAYGSFAASVSDDSYYATVVAERCTDSTFPSSWESWREKAAAQNRVAPFTTWGNAWYLMPCRTWPIKASGRFPIDTHGVKALLMDDQFDGNTPVGGDQAARELFPTSPLVIIKNGLNHLDSLTNPCELRLVTRYLATGWLTPRQQGPGPDLWCAPDPRPKP